MTVSNKTNPIKRLFITVLLEFPLLILHLNAHNQMT
jgi:hypothetical protein